MSEEKGLKDEIRELREAIEPILVGKAPKEFKIPRRARIGKRKARDNWVTVMFVNENGNVDFKKEKIKEQVITVDGVPRFATGEHILNWKKNPIMIQPSWSIEPFSPSQNYKDSITNQTNTNGYRLMLNYMMSETISNKKKISVGLIIGGLVILVVAGYFLMGS